ncbi:MAG: A/G-specific adenine glycosylase [Clostridia bacterium]|nr:A/G-specific adenine glycosylase [Clostridia bacterium]
MQQIDLSPIIEPLLAWYEQNHRPLPWRDSPTPYHVWLSEIMLQQTRIEAVIPYYERFLSACPTVEALACVDDEQLMKLWEGLGYYSRARNLKKAAQRIMEQHKGELPASYEALLALPGIGPYTAGAISSIAFGLPEPAVDGNVLRVVTRLTADESDIMKDTTKRRVTASLRAMYPQAMNKAANLTQALMELGEQVCIPNGGPHCESCPLGATCMARARNLTDRIPVRTPKKERAIQPRTIFLLMHGDKVALRKRGDKGLLSGLWEFIGREGWCELPEAQAWLKEQGAHSSRLIAAPDATHIFTHIEWRMKGYFVLCDDAPSELLGQTLVWVTRKELHDMYALPTAFRAYVRALDDFSPREA